jgi:hypothetical protein
MGQEVLRAPEELVKEVERGFVRDQKEQGLFLGQMVLSNAAELGELGRSVFDGEEDDVHD